MSNKPNNDILNTMKMAGNGLKKKKNVGFPTPPVGFAGPKVRIDKKPKSSKKTEKINLMDSMVKDMTNPSKIGPVGEKFSNNGKKKKKYQSESSSSSMSGSSMSGSSGSSMSGSSGSSMSGSSISGSSGSSMSSRKSFRNRKAEEKKRKEELAHEKVEMLTRIVNLSKNGFATTKKWNMKDDIDEIRYECYRMQRESNTKKSIKMMQQVLVSVTTLVEMGNSYFNPFNLRLDGFSKNMMLSLSDYDDCFDQLHHKYSGRSSTGPELQLMFTFASAAIFHHAGNAINAKDDSKSKPAGGGMASMMGMMGMLNGLGGNKPQPIRKPVPKSTVVVEEDTEPETSTEKPKRRTMKGPGSSASIPAGLFGAPENKPAAVPSMKIPV